ncbi:MAG: IPT/TIG domain-containing protein [Dysgonamonadaceae bacterium]|jgi:hypothetical protein|nr:IPT/TIG domain-containing protein [Dysgonamonadaceae bacterium]
MRTKILVLSAALVLSANLRAQVTIGSANAPKAGAILDLNSGAKGGLILSNVSLDNTGEIPAGFPGMSGAEIAVAKAQLKGAMVYNTNPNTCVGVHAWDGNHWARPISPQKSVGETLTLTSSTTNLVGGDNIGFAVSTEAKTYTWYINPNGAGYEYLGVTTAPKLETAIPAGTVKLKVIADNCHVLEESNEVTIQSETLSPKFGSTDGGNYIYIYGDFPYASTNDYVQNGLIVYFDGINNAALGDKLHSNDATEWVDLEQGIKLPLTNTPTDSYWGSNGWQVGNDGVAFNRMGSLVAYGIPGGGSERTVETIFQRPNHTSYTSETFVSGYGLSTVLNQSFNFAYFSGEFGVEAWGGFSTGIATSLSSYPNILLGKLNIVSSQAAYYGSTDGRFSFFLNGNRVTNLSQGSYNKNINTIIDNANSYLSIGCRSGAHPLKGYRLLNYRIYNRVLTETEIQHNADLDQIRYLTPPTVTIDDVPCTEVVVLSSHFLMCKVPPTSSANIGYKNVKITVGSNPPLVLNGAYQYVNAASAFYVSSIAPIIGDANTPNQPLMLTGNNLDKIDEINVGGQPCTNLSVTPDGKTLTCILPSIDAGEVDIILTMDDNTIYRFAKVFEFN